MIPSRRLLVVTTVAVAVVLLAGPVAADWSAGVDLYQQGRFAEAAIHFRETVGSNPDWPSGYLMLGRCQLALEEYDEALENLRTAVELGPDDPTNTVTLGRALMTVDRYTEARELLDGFDLDSLPPEWKAEVARMQAACLIEEDRAADALALLETRLADDPNRAALHRALADAHREVGDRTATLDDLTRAFRLDPADHASGRSAVTAALTLAADAGNDELAVGYYGRAVEIADEMATASPDYENTLLAGEAAFAAGRFRPLPAGSALRSRAGPRNPPPNSISDAPWRPSTTTRRPSSTCARRSAPRPRPSWRCTSTASSAGCWPAAWSFPKPPATIGLQGTMMRADQIDTLAAGFREALERLATLRNSTAELARMEAELDELGDAKGVRALADRRWVMGQEIAGIEDNLSEVRAALCW